MSPEPAHEALIDVDTYIQAQQVSGHWFGSRSSNGPWLEFTIAGDPAVL